MLHNNLERLTLHSVLSNLFNKYIIPYDHSYIDAYHGYVFLIICTIDENEFAHRVQVRNEVEVL
jgi:hypothetical protein